MCVPACMCVSAHVRACMLLSARVRVCIHHCSRFSSAGAADSLFSGCADNDVATLQQLPTLAHSAVSACLHCSSTAFLSSCSSPKKNKDLSCRSCSSLSSRSRPGDGRCMRFRLSLLSLSCLHGGECNRCISPQLRSLPPLLLDPLPLYAFPL